MYNCPEIRERLTEIKTLKEELVSGLSQAQNHEDTLILVNLQEKIEEKMKSLEEMLSIDIEDLERRHQEGKPLSKRELWFVYKLDKLFNKEIRVKEGEDIEKRRKRIEIERENKKRDLAQALDCKEEQISLTKEKALSGDIKYHYNYLDLGNYTSAKDLKLPKSIGGHLNLKGLTSAEDLRLPESIGGSLELNNLISAKDLKLPESIGGSLNLFRLTSAKDLKLPESIGGSLNIMSLTSTEGLKLPESIGGSLALWSLTSAKDLKLPKSIGGNLNLNKLTSVEGLELTCEIKGKIYLENFPQEEKEELKKRYPHLASKI